MKVLLVVEDCTHDKHVLLPIVRAALARKTSADCHVRVCEDARFQGVSTVMSLENLREVVEFNLIYSVFVVCVDMDCDDARWSKLDAILNRLRDLFPAKSFLAVCAQHESEVWVLAGMTDLPREWQLVTIRNECDPKEVYFEKYVARRGLQDTPGYGRSILGRQAAKQYDKRVRIMCKEVQAIEDIR